MFEFYFLIVYRRIHKPEVCMDVFIFIQIVAQSRCNIYFFYVYVEDLMRFFKLHFDYQNTFLAELPVFKVVS